MASRVLKSAQAGLAALAATALPFAVAASAEDAQRTVPATAAAATTATVSFVEDADNSATEWNASNPGAIAVAVYMGTQGELTPDQLTTGLTNVAKDGGVENIEFFFEQNDAPYTGFALYYHDVFKGPLTLDEIIPETQQAANYLKTDEGLFQTASNDYDALN